MRERLGDTTKEDIVGMIRTLAGEIIRARAEIGPWRWTCSVDSLQQFAEWYRLIESTQRVLAQPGPSR